MLNWTLLFLLVALTAGVLGFGGIAGTAATIAKICFIIFLAFFVAGLLPAKTGRCRGSPVRFLAGNDAGQV